MKYEEFKDEYQEEICKHCEEYILETSSNSIFFQCEGCSCDEAEQQYIKLHDIKIDE